MFFTTEEERIIIQFLSKSAFFSGVSTRSLKSLVRQFIPTPFKSGEYVMRQGEPGDCLYLVMHGRLRVYEKTNGQLTSHGEIGPGEFIGEVALLTNSPRIFSVFTIRDSILLKLNKEDFFYFSKNHFEQMIEIVKNTIIRIKDKNYINNRVHTFCLMPAGSSTDLRAFSNTFINTLNGRFLYLTQHNIKKHLANAGIDLSDVKKSDQVTRWLNEQENNYRYIIYESGPELNDWSKLCIRQADKVLLIAKQTAKVCLSPLENFLFENSHCNRDLVILQPDNISLPLDARKWLENRPVQSHHHISLSQPNSLSRLLRYLTNRSIGLVLGGGGARGYAHIGVIKALKEYHIPIDSIGGTSSGAAIGALFAMNLPIDEIIYLIKKHVAHNKRLIKYTLPIHSVVSGRSISEAIIALMGEDTLTENLWRRFFCIATSLTSLEQKVLTHGKLWRNIRASLSIPGIFPPISTSQEELLLDGAIINNLPVDIMENFSNSGYIIASDVSGKPKITSNAVPEGWISPWNSLKENLYNKRLPTIPEIMLESALLCSNQHQVAMSKRANLSINCFTENFPVLGWGLIDKLINLGYETALSHLEQNKVKLPSLQPR